MSASKKSLRTPPERTFSNYVFTKISDEKSGLLRISDDKFQSMPGVSDGYADDGLTSELIDIGFDLTINAVTYKKMLISTNGWLALADPTKDTTGSVYVSVLASASYQNQGIILNNTSSTALLCPWFDNLQNVANDFSQAPADVNSSSYKLIQEGLESPSLSYNESAYGTKIYYDTRSNEGRRTIVRWNSLSDFINGTPTTAPQSLIRFECVLYENGKIEFRYADKASLAIVNDYTLISRARTNATIGMFFPGTNNFRDLSFGLGYNEEYRTPYKYGAYTYNSSWYDSGFDSISGEYINKEYAWRLIPQQNWPGLKHFGTTMAMQPPVERRKVLPLAETKTRANSKSFPNITQLHTHHRNTLFDDRRSLPFISGVSVNYPTTLQRYSADGTRGISERQDLFVGQDKDFLVTGMINKQAVDQFLFVNDDNVADPFNESLINNHASTGSYDDFFLTASNYDAIDGINSPVWSKAKIQLSFRVDNTTQLLSQSACIYYYNNGSKSWLVPRAGAAGDLGDATNMLRNYYFAEDHRGFGPLGNPITSGSNDQGAGSGTDTYINSPFSIENAAVALTRKYAKSIETNSDYEAQPSEYFSLPISTPFLIEKAIIDIPIAAGDGWFADKTEAFSTITGLSGAFDMGGPALTFALFNQVKLGTSSRRDLIMSGTITHEYDNTSELVLSNFPNLASDYQYRPRGFLAYAANPAGIVYSADSTIGSRHYTGSIKIKTEALSSNGVLVSYINNFDSGTAANNRSALASLAASEYISLVSGSTTYENTYNIIGVNAFGRALTGFEQSGRSVFGREYVTTQNFYASQKQGFIKNPFYLTGSAYDDLVTSIDGITGFKCRAIAAKQLQTQYKSPYLVFPNSRLILALAKSRPFIFDTSSVPSTSASISHDVQLITGAITLTLYGSVLRESKEIEHADNSQELVSNTIHHDITPGPVVDQFNVFYRDEFVGTYIDDYITGSLVKTVVGSNQKIEVQSGHRGKVFSRYHARSAAAPDTSAAEILSNSSYAFRLQPWYERVGNTIARSHVDINERYYDSLMPSIADCFGADSTGIFVVKSTAQDFGDYQKVESGSTGYIFFDSQTSYAHINNQYWLHAFPFEPRYAAAPRQNNIQKSFIANYTFDTTNVVQINPVPVNGFYFGPRDNGIYTWLSDVNLANTTGGGYYLTGSAAVDDIARALYGFGDGPDGFADYRSHETYTSPGGNVSRFLFSPIIRGWKYGVFNGLPTYTHAKFRHDHYGQFRDMLEQRLFTKFQLTQDNATPSIKQTITSAPVTIIFLDAGGNITDPENTSCQNLSFESTSSLPYFDGDTRDRNAIVPGALNSGIISIGASSLGSQLL